LRAGGVLINLQPYARPINLEVRLGGQRRQAGIALENPEKLEDMKQSLLEVAGSVAAGWFSPRDELKWQFEMRYPTPEDWQEFLDRPSNGGVEADQKLLETALERTDGYVCSVEDDLAQLYKCDVAGSDPAL
jgi:hypothetical protein